jgi:hypothetical protein
MVPHLSRSIKAFRQADRTDLAVAPRLLIGDLRLVENLLSPEEFEATRLQLEKMYHEKVLDRRVRSIRVNSSYRWQPQMTIEVGKFASHLTPDGPPEKIVAIYESRSFLVCTPGHGFEGGRPYIFPRTDVKGAAYDD